MGLLTGLISMIVISVTAFIQKKDLVPLESFTDGCPDPGGNGTTLAPPIVVDIVDEG